MSAAVTPDFDQFSNDDVVPILQRARMFAYPDLPTAAGMVQLIFDAFVVFIYIDPDVDALECTRSPPEARRQDFSLEMSASFWDPIVGKSLANAWLMTSDRGYRDAIQLRFRQFANDGPYTIVQLYGQASEIVISELGILRLHQS